MSKKKALPQNYFVPNFGGDHDINVSKINLHNAEARLNHKWNPDMSKKK